MKREKFIKKIEELGFKKNVEYITGWEREGLTIFIGDDNIIGMVCGTHNWGFNFSTEFNEILTQLKRCPHQDECQFYRFEYCPSLPVPKEKKYCPLWKKGIEILLKNSGWLKEE